MFNIRSLLATSLLHFFWCCYIGFCVWVLRYIPYDILYYSLVPTVVFYGMYAYYDKSERFISRKLAVFLIPKQDFKNML